jgi:hypothetical protein
VSFLWDTQLFPDATSPTHLKFSDVPLEDGPGAPAGSRRPVDVYLPVNADGSYTLVLQSNPAQTLIRIDPNRAPSCSLHQDSSVAIPTLSRWAIAALLISFLAIGTVAIRKMRIFS